MRLLSAKQTEDERKKDQAELAKQHTQLLGLIEKERKELQAFKIEKERQKEMILADFNTFIQEISRKQMALANEIAALENRKKELITKPSC
jgi:hypothetical protein